MIDIQKIKDEYESKLHLAELSNQLEEKTGLECHLSSSSYSKSHGTKYGATYGFGCNGGHYWDSEKKWPTIQDAARLMNLMPPTQDWISSQDDWSGPFLITTGRGFRDSYGYVEFRWTHNDIDFSFYLCIETNEVLKPLFDVVKRQIDSSELSTYHPVDQYGKLDHERMIPRYRFSGVSNDKQTNYQGGYVYLLDNNKAAEIIELIKSQIQ